MNNSENISVLGERLTDSNFWNSCYEDRDLKPFDDRDWKNLVSVQIVRLLESLSINEKSVCEVGGGDGEFLAYLAKRYPTAEFSVIDFSPSGCELARIRAKREGVTLNVYQADVFSPPSKLQKHFDLVISHGVVEHFTDLTGVMAAKKRLLKDDGIVLTLIPNFSSPIYAYLCKRWSKTIWDDHVPHDMRSFLAGHEQAGLMPLKQGFLGAIEFGMLSMAITNGPERKTRFDRQFYLFLSRLSKVIHFLEYRTTDFPATKLFSPFMYVVSANTDVPIDTVKDRSGNT